MIIYFPLTTEEKENEKRKRRKSSRWHRFYTTNFSTLCTDILLEKYL